MAISKRCVYVDVQCNIYDLCTGVSVRIANGNVRAMSHCSERLRCMSSKKSLGCFKDLFFVICDIKIKIKKNKWICFLFCFCYFSTYGFDAVKKLIEESNA